jgi:hypothetical protein
MKLLKYLRKPQQDKPKGSKFAIAKDSVFNYKSGADVVATWKKTGWVPPSEYRTDFLFGEKK